MYAECTPQNGASTSVKRGIFYLITFRLWVTLPSIFSSASENAFVHHVQPLLKSFSQKQALKSKLPLKEVSRITLSKAKAKKSVARV